jgi:hypothetical protein
MCPLQKGTVNTHANIIQKSDTAPLLQNDIAYETIGSTSFDMRSQILILVVWR